MRTARWIFLSTFMLAATANAGTLVNGVGAITSGLNNNNAGTGGTLLANTGTILDGLYGTENLGYLVDDFDQSLSWSDNLVIRATAEANDEGTVSGADQAALLGYFGQSFATGHRSEAAFAISLLPPNDGRIFLNIGGNLVGPVGNWASDFGRNNPFDIDLSATEAAGVLAVTGTISDGSTTINVAQVGNVNSAETILAFGTSSAFGPQLGTERNFGLDFSDVSYIGTAIPEPTGMALAGVAALVAVAAGRRLR